MAEELKDLHVDEYITRVKMKDFQKQLMRVQTWKFHEYMMKEQMRW